MAGNVAPNITTDGLVLYLDAANTKSYISGSTTWLDLAGTNNGTLINGPTYNPANNGSIVFDGTNDYFTTNTQFAIPTNNRTFDVWVKFNTSGSSANYSPILVQTTAFNNNDSKFLTGLQKFSGNFNIIQPVANGSTYNAYSNGFNYTSSIGNWINIVGTIEGGVASKIYLNTSLVSNVSITINPEQAARHVVIGFWPGPQFNISVARIYNRALSAAEILQNYNATRGRFGL